MKGGHPAYFLNYQHLQQKVRKLLTGYTVAVATSFIIFL